MNLSTDKKYLFIAIPKTGTTSIEKNLLEYGHWLIDGKPTHKHIFAQTARKMLGQQRFDEYFKFTFVRNPWDLYRSFYRYTIKMSQAAVPEILFHDKFVQKCKQLHQDGVLTFEEFIHNKILHPPAQYKFITDNDDNIIVDYIGKFEHIDKDYEHICSKIGIKYNPVPHLNKASLYSSYRTIYTKETKDIVEERCKMDIEMFKYKF